jgi:serine/threonine protein kinase
VKDFFYDSSEFYLNIVLELCSGSLRNQLNKNHTYSEAELISFMTQIISAFLELENKKIMHLDLKPENILLADDDGKHYKICDFGCSQMSEISRLSGYETQVFGTFNYLAPEVYLNYKGSKHRNSADIWAFGITLY